MASPRHALTVAVALAALCVGVSPALPAEGARWTVVQDRPAANVQPDYYRMSFFDANNGWIVGGRLGEGVEGSYVGFKTSDGGRTWRDIHIPKFRVWMIDGEPVVDLSGDEVTRAGAKGYSVHLISPTEAWVGGAERLGHTTDGGETWEVLHFDQVLPDVRRVRIVADKGRLNAYSLHFWNSMEGVMVILAQHLGEGSVTGGLVLATQDGGRSWRPRSSAIAGWRLTMSSPTTGWMTSNTGLSGLYVTTDAWRSADRLIEGEVYDAFFAEDGRAWAVARPIPNGGSATVLRSPDNGGTWMQSVIDNAVLFARRGRIEILGLAFGSGSNGWAAGAGGLVMGTEDGIEWTAEKSPFVAEVADIQYIDGVVYAVARDGMVARRESAPTGVGSPATEETMWGRIKRARRMDGAETWPHRGTR